MTNPEDNSELHIIKKYPNRRLYDTTQSAYITLEGVRELIIRHDRFQVIDSKSGTDITRTILLQIIGEQEANNGTGNPLFSNIFLEQLIRFYGNSLQGLLSEYLEKSLQSFMQQQHILRKQMQNVMDINPMKIMSLRENTNTGSEATKKSEEAENLNTHNSQNQS